MESKKKARLMQSFHFPVDCMFGEGALKQFLENVCDGSRLVNNLKAKQISIITSKRLLDTPYENTTLGGMIQHLGSHYPTNINLVLPDRTGEPTQSQTWALAHSLRDLAAAPQDVVLVIGGGSLMDLSKAAVSLSQTPSPKTALAAAYEKGELPKRVCLFVTVPTTSGTGSEMTPISVLKNEQTGSKTSFRHLNLYSDHAIIDPMLACSMPSSLAAASGMDALTQAIEVYSGKKRNPISMDLALKGAGIIYRELRASVLGTGRRQKDARTAVHRCASTVGIALAAGGCGIVHAFANPIGGLTGKAHGLINGILLPYAMKFNIELTDKKAENETHEPTARSWYDAIAKECGEKDASSLIAGIQLLAKDLSIPSCLGDIGVRESDSDFIEEHCYSGSFRNNIITLSKDDIQELLGKALTS